MVRFLLPGQTGMGIIGEIPYEQWANDPNLRKQAEDMYGQMGIDPHTGHYTEEGWNKYVSGPKQIPDPGKWSGMGGLAIPMMDNPNYGKPYPHGQSVSTSVVNPTRFPAIPRSPSAPRLTDILGNASTSAANPPRTAPNPAGGTWAASLGLPPEYEHSPFNIGQTSKYASPTAPGSMWENTVLYGPTGQAFNPAADNSWFYKDNNGDWFSSQFLPTGGSGGIGVPSSSVPLSVLNATSGTRLGDIMNQMAARQEAPLNQRPPTLSGILGSQNTTRTAPVTSTTAQAAQPRINPLTGRPLP